ncbi:MAG: flippase-like domain-containing protein [Candidatus Thermoplasmatota archaeon]|jgi:uncharacterized protein (TIRG00374 family)|nr:flippase-like domain-containing protein [Candidatus Thermoplasmatota archaeon]
MGPSVTDLLKRHWKDALYISLGLFIIAFLLLRADVTDTLDVMSGIDLRLLLLVLGLYFMNTFSKVLRWYGLLKGMGARNLGPIVLPIFLSSLAINNSTPGKVGGDPVRALMLKDHTGNRISLGAATIFAEKSLDMVTILIFAFIGMAHMMLLFGARAVLGLSVVVVVGAIIIVTIILLVLHRGFVSWVTGRIGSIMLKASGGDASSPVYRTSSKLSGFMERFHLSIARIGRDPWTGTGVILLTGSIWMNEALRMFLILEALPGDNPVTLLGAMAAISVANILGFVLPVGSGNVVGSTSVLELLTGNGPLAAAASLVMVTTSVWISIPSGVVSLVLLRLREKRNVKR